MNIKGTFVDPAAATGLYIPCIMPLLCHCCHKDFCEGYTCAFLLIAPPTPFCSIFYPKVFFETSFKVGGS